MQEAFKIMPLTCRHCGRPLPVMGHYVTFQCQTCFRYWVLTPDGLKTITVYRVAQPDGMECEPVQLPFWVIGIDHAELRDQTERILGDLRERTQKIATTELEMEEPELEGLIMGMEGVEQDSPAAKKARFLSEASRTLNAPTAAEIGYLLRRIEDAGTFLIYVPAFLSMNMHIHLRVGRLFTKRQPRYRIEKSSGLGRPVLCALQADEAISLIDFIFFATLPDSIQMNGDFLKSIRLKPVHEPRLIEFPFERRGDSLVSCIDGFQIPGNHIEGL